MLGNGGGTGEIPAAFPMTQIIGKADRFLA